MSPEVYQDVKLILTATATSLSLPMELPNEGFSPPEPTNTWVSIDVGGDAAETIELGNLTWLENGAVWIHLMIPLGNGIEAALAQRKSFSVAFRATPPTVEGLHYRDQTFEPLGADDGVWRRLTLIVRYDYNDIQVV